MANAINKEYKSVTSTYVVHFSSGKELAFNFEHESLDDNKFFDNLLNEDWNKDVYFFKDICISEYDISSAIINLKNVEFIERID